MSVFEHSRFQVFSKKQHPYAHDASEFFYANPRIPLPISNIEEALNYIIAVLYPNYIGTFATPAHLPGTASPNDYAFVTDDGDGKSAGYVYTSIDGVTQWVKRYDVDWSTDSVLAELMDRTQYRYAHKYGFDDIDANGAVIQGLYKGQRIYGGLTTGGNLTFNANSEDATGFVQTDNTFRPTTNGTLDLGTSSERWSVGYINTLVAGSLTATSGSITDTSGTISFDDENLITTGLLGSGTHTVSNDLVLAVGSITSASGSIDFDDENLSTTGNISCTNLTASNSLQVSGFLFQDIAGPKGEITHSSGTISFHDENLETTGTLLAGDATVTRLDSDNIRIDGNTVSVLNTNGNLVLSANGSGIVDIQSNMTTLGQTVTGTVSITGQLNIDNIRIDGNVISSQNLNGNIFLQPNGSGYVESSARLLPSSEGTLDLGAAVRRWKDLYLSGSIHNGTDAITITDLLTLRDAPRRADSSAAQIGDSLFWDGSKWVADHPDTEVTHSEISGLVTGDAGHTQFVMLAGRSGGQTVQGGTSAFEDLVLESTAHASKGTVQSKDHFLPFTSTDKDLGSVTRRWRDIHMSGEARGLRLENFTSGTLPSSSALAVGRAVWATDNKKVYVDTGTAFTVASVSRHIEDTVWNGTDTTKTVTVSSNISDARNAIWQLRDNVNGFEIIYAKIETTATQVTITVNPPLPAGSYRLIGLE